MMDDYSMEVLRSGNEFSLETIKAADDFIKKNYPLISDDKVATFKKNGMYYAVPSHPHHRPHRKVEDLGYFVKNVLT